MTIMDFVDLHTHTQASDGTDDPAELVRKALTLGLRAVAVTDHDTLAGLDAAQEAGWAYGITVIRGCEVSATSPYGEVHILGLWLPHDAGPLAAVLESQRQQRERRNHSIVEKLNAHGMPLTYDDVLAAAAGETVGRPHIAAALMKRGYTSSVREGFKKWLGSGGKAFVPRKTLALEEAVRLLAGLGATVSIAHPRLIHCPHPWLEATIAALKPCGLTALEAYHSEHSEAAQRHCVDIAARHGLELTGGSDYHGQTKPDIALGTGRGALRVPVFVLEKLEAARRQRGLPV